MFRYTIKKILLSKECLEKRRKSYPIMVLFIEKYIEENYPGWYEYLAKSACPICRTLIPDPKQLHHHLTNLTRCAHALNEIISDIMSMYSQFYRYTCKYYYSNYRKQLIIWLSSYGIGKTVELCKKNTRAKNARKDMHSSVLF